MGKSTDKSTDRSKDASVNKSAKNVEAETVTGTERSSNERIQKRQYK